MFGKLIKYEMKSSMKIFFLVWGAVLAMGLVNGFVIRTGMESGWSILPIVLYVLLMTSIFVLTMVFIIQRFYKGLLGEEGYLMFTLPTTPRKLIISKAVSAAIISAISLIVGAISVLLMGLPSLEHPGIKLFFSQLKEALKVEPALPVFAVLIVVICILGLFTSIYQIYASIGIGQLFDKHRVLFSVIAYIAISVIAEFIGVAFMNLARINSNFVDMVIDWLERDNTVGGIVMLLGIIVVQLIVVGIFHIVTEFILSKKLNLE